MTLTKSDRRTADDPATGLSRFQARGLMLALTAAFFITTSVASQSQAQTLDDPIIPLEIDQIVPDGQGGLLGLGTIGGEQFEVPIDLSLVELLDVLEPGDACAILNLELGPIFLDLLGLQVETSAICLEITAVPGEGALLGNLLCGIAGLLDGGLPIEDILAGLTQDELELLQGLINEILAIITTPAEATNVAASQPGRRVGPPAGRPGGPGGPGGPPDRDQVTRILFLEIGPLELNLLGLEIYLHDCEDGPVTVEIRAVGGEGRLLGNLLGQLARLFDGPLPALENVLGRINDEITRLLALNEPL
jgi:hypothetical protein